MNATIFSADTGATSTLNLPATLPYSGQSTVVLTKGISGLGGNAGEEEQPVWYNPDPTSAGGNTFTLSGDTLTSFSLIRHCDGKEFGAIGLVPPIPIVSSSASATGVVTVTTQYPHFLKTGRKVWIYDNTDGTLLAGSPYVVTVSGDPTTSTTFTVSLSGASGGTGGYFCINQYNGIFIESSQVDGGPNGYVQVLHTADTTGSGNYVESVRLLITRPGTFTLQDRQGVPFITNSADGATLTLGGGNVTSIVAAQPISNLSCPSITVATNGTTYIILKDTNLGSNRQWNIDMQDDGALRFEYFNGSIYITTPMLISNTGKTSLGGGKLNLAGIPTSSSGLVSGDVYSNAGILSIVP